MEEDFSKFVRGFSITGVGILYSAVMFYAAALITVNLLGPTLYGMYSLAYMIPSVAVYFLLFGLDVTAARYIAHNLGKKNEEKALKCAQTIFAVRMPVAFFSMIVFFFLSDFFARILGEDIALGLQLLSLYIFVLLVIRYLMAVLQGYFLLKERTITEAVSNTLSLIFLLPLFYFGFGYISPILAFVFALLAAIALSVYYLERAGIPVFRIRFEGFQELKEYLKFSYHVYISDSFAWAYVWIGTVVIKAYSMPVETVGYYRAMFSITSTVVLISYGLTVVLYPMLSELHAREEYGRLSFSLRKVVKYALALSIPAAFGMLLVSEPLVSTLFPKYIAAVDLLRIFSLRMIFLPLWSILATSLLTLDRAKQQALISIFLCSFTFVLSLILGVFSVEGIAVANTVGLACATILQYIVLKKRVIHLNAGPVLKFCFSAAIMCAVVWLILQVDLGDSAKVGLSLVCGIILYSFLVLKTGAVSEIDIEMMRSGLSVFGRFGKKIEVILNLAQKIQKL
jgi:O-antigen/teichoic acid export membrane protein